MNLAALDGYPSERMKLHVHSSEWKGEQVEVLLALHTYRYKSELYWIVIDFCGNSISDLVGQLEFV